MKKYPKNFDKLEKVNSDGTPFLKPQHTQGKLYSTESACTSSEFKMEDNTFSVFVASHAEAIKPCLTFGFTKQEAEANAQRIVKAVNSFDELLESLKESQKLLQRIVNGEKPTTLNEQITLNILAINKAETE